MTRLAQGLLWLGAAVAVGVGVGRSDPEAGLSTSSGGDARPVAQPHVGITRSSRDVELGGGRAGRLAKVLVQPGDAVEPGQVLFELENGVERLELAGLELRLESRADLQLARARLDQAQAAYDRVADLAGQRIASEAKRIEVDADLRAARAEVVRAEEARALLRVERDQAAARLELSIGRSPIAGVVERRLHDVGESLDQLEPVVEVVALSPLHVEFHCPVDELAAWPLGALARVSCGTDGDSRYGAVVFRGRQTEFASQTVLVRLEVPNEEHDWLAGRKVRIERAEGPTAPAPSAGTRQGN